MRDVLQYPIDGELRRTIGQVQHTGSLVDGLAQLKAVGDLFVGRINK